MIILARTILFALRIITVGNAFFAMIGKAGGSMVFDEKLSVQIGRWMDEISVSDCL